MPGTLFVVATPIGNLEDITARALRVLREASIIAAEDTRRTACLLARYAITTPTTSLHAHNEAQKTASLIARLTRGEHVALVSDAGTPTIADPGQRLVSAATDAGIRVESIPGPNAAVAALAVSGFPTDSFAFLGFPPTKAKPRAEWFERARLIGGTVVFYEAPHRIRRSLEELRAAVGDCEVVVCRELTKLHEESVKGPISTILTRLASKGEFTVVAKLGQSQEPAQSESDLDGMSIADIGRLIETEGAQGRQAVARLASRYGVRPNTAYAAIMARRKSAK